MTMFAFSDIPNSVTLSKHNGLPINEQNKQQAIFQTDLKYFHKHIFFRLNTSKHTLNRPETASNEGFLGHSNPNPHYKPQIITILQTYA